MLAPDWRRSSAWPESSTPGSSSPCSGAAGSSTGFSTLATPRSVSDGHNVGHSGWRGRRSRSSEWGERGAIDELCLDTASQTLLVVELKTVLADTQAVLARLDAKVRLAPGLARRFGWRVATVVPCLVLSDTRTNRRRVAAHPAAFAAFSCRGLAARRWLVSPLPPVEGLLLFEPGSNLHGAHVRPPGRQRIRRRPAPLSVEGGRTDGPAAGSAP